MTDTTTLLTPRQAAALIEKMSGVPFLARRALAWAAKGIGDFPALVVNGGKKLMFFDRKQIEDWVDFTFGDVP